MQEGYITAVMRFLRHEKDAQNTPGVFALWCKEGGHRALLSILESDNIQLSLLRYMQLQNLRLRTANHIEFSAFYTPDMDKAARQRIATELSRRAFALPV